MADKIFSYMTPDSLGVIPDLTLPGHNLIHANGKTYIVTGYAWMGADDVWGFVHTSPEGVICVRPVSHILGNRAYGSPRYLVFDRTRALVERMFARG